MTQIVVHRAAKRATLGAQELTPSAFQSRLANFAQLAAATTPPFKAEGGEENGRRQAPDLRLGKEGKTMLPAASTSTSSPDREACPGKRSSLGKGAGIAKPVGEGMEDTRPAQLRSPLAAQKGVEEEELR